MRSAIFVSAAALFCILLTACGDDETGTTLPATATTCIDVDGDGYGDLCELGDDCDDSDAERYRSALGFTDGDGDGYTAGTAAVVCSGATLPEGVVATSLGRDCNDGDAGLFAEQIGFVDSDGDSYGAGEVALVCSGDALPSGYAGRDGDCDDASQAAFENVLAYVDGDGDGVGAEPAVICAGGEFPEGYASDGGDCDDGEASLQACPSGCIDGDEDGYGVGCDDGEDCDDGDEDVYQWTLAWVDFDRDGLGDDDGGTVLCAGDSLGDGYADVGGDCNDDSTSTYQLVVGYADDDDDGAGGGDATLVCTGVDLPDGFVAESGDCDDDDGDNVLSCSTCLDVDGDGYYTGCDAYETRQGPDCHAHDGYRYQWLDGYRDWDEDTYTVGEAVALCTGEELPSPYIAAASDTDDCNDFADDLYRTTDLYFDLDDDGVASDEVTRVCYGDEAPDGFISTDDPGVDCDDMDPNRYQLLTGYSDWDSDDFTLAEGVEVCSGDELPDAYLATASGEEDCDDLAVGVNPGADEIPGDFVDQDCVAGDPLPTNGDGYFADDDAACDGSGTIESPYCSLDDAVEAAIENGGAVYLASGDYDPGFDAPLSVDIYGGFNSSFNARADGNDTVLFHDAGPNPVLVVPAEATVRLANLTVDNDSEDESRTIDNAGHLTLWNVSVEANVASRDYFVIYNRESATLDAHDSVLTSADSCESSSSIGLHNLGVAYLDNVTIEAIFSSADGEAVGIESFGPLVVVDSSITMGSAETVRGITSRGSLVLRDTDIDIEGGDGCDASTDDIENADGINHVTEAPYDVQGGSIDVPSSSVMSRGLFADVGDHAQRLVDVTIDVGGTGESRGVVIAECESQGLLTDNVITATSSQDARGMHFSNNDYLVGRNEVVLGAGTNTRWGITTGGGPSGVLYDNTLTIAAATDGRSRGVHHDGHLLAVENDIELASTTEGVQAISGWSSNVSQALYFNEVTILGAGDHTWALVNQGSELVAVGNVILITINNLAFPISYQPLEGGGEALLDGNHIECLGAACRGVLVVGDADVMVLNNDFHIAEGDKSNMQAFDGIHLRLEGADAVVAHNNVTSGWGVNGGTVSTRGIRVAETPSSVIIYDNTILPSGVLSRGDVYGVDVSGRSIVVEANHIATGDTTHVANFGLNVAGSGLVVNNVIQTGAGLRPVGVNVPADGIVVELVNNTVYSGAGGEGEDDRASAIRVIGDSELVIVGNILMPGPATLSVGILTWAGEIDVLVDNLIWGSAMTMAVQIEGEALEDIAALEVHLRRERSFATGNLSEDPLLESFPGDDYHLTEGSPAIDAATTVIYDVYRDLDGDGRPVGGVDDIGADEYVPAP